MCLLVLVQLRWCWSRAMTQQMDSVSQKDRKAQCRKQWDTWWYHPYPRSSTSPYQIIPHRRWRCDCASTHSSLAECTGQLVCPNMDELLMLGGCYSWVSCQAIFILLQGHTLPLAVEAPISWERQCILAIAWMPVPTNSRYIANSGELSP